MSDQSQGPDWWVASDGKWYPPESHPSRSQPPPPPSTEIGEVDASPPDAGEGKAGKFRGWKRWATIGVAAVVVLVVLAALFGGTADDDPGDTSVSIDSEADAITDEAAGTGAGEDGADEKDEDAGDSSTAEETASTPTATPPPTPEPVEPEVGTRDVPWAYDAPTSVTFETFGDADGSVWNVTIGVPQDITDVVLGENQFNDPPLEGVVFVGFSVEMTLIEAAKEPLSPGFNFSWELLGGSTAAVYNTSTIGEGFGCGVAPDEFNDFAEVFVGGNLTGTVCIPLPTEDLGLAQTQVALNFSEGNRAVFGQ